MKGMKLTEEEHQRRLDCYNQGMKDREAGVACGIHATTFCEWRKQHNLPPNGRTLWTDELKALTLELYLKGWKYEEIAERIGKEEDLIRAFIKRHKFLLSVKAKKRQDKKEDRDQLQEIKRMQCYENGLSDKDSAAECGISRKEYTLWRTGKGLEEHPEIIVSPKKARNPSQKSSKLTAADAKKYYRHDKHKPPVTYKSTLTVIEDKEKAEQLLAELGDKIKQRDPNDRKVYNLNGKSIGNQTGRTMTAIAAYGR